MEPTRRMKAVKDWISSHLASMSQPLSRTRTGNNNFYDDEPLHGEYGDGGSTPTAGLSESHESAATARHDYSSNPENQLTLEGEPNDEFHLSNSHIIDDKGLNPLAKIEALQIKFLRLVHRLGQPQDNLLVAQALYRLHLATLIRAGELDLKRSRLRSNEIRAIAAEQEAAGQPELDFSLRILVLGKTGVGKSATINSIFEQTKATTDAFKPSTCGIEEVVGNIDGIKVTIVDTPGLFPSSTSNLRKNRGILLSVKRYIRRSPPDIVLYFERLDLINMAYSDLPLLKLITDIFGSAIWFNTILVMTHSSSVLREGPNGYPVRYESFVTLCQDLVQHYIHQALSDSKLENPVVLVENHPQCEKNALGEKVLPNGHVWRSQLLLLCVCTKVLGDANSFFKFRDNFQMGPPSRSRLPSLPHLLSTLIRPRPESTSEMYDEIDEISDSEEEDEYEQLPPIRILKKSQFERLTKSQKNEYLDELDYRETLYLKKQLKDDIRKRREKMLREDTIAGNDDNYDDREDPPEAVQLPDIALPPSFDSIYPAHRYRCLVTSDQWLVRPVLDPQGWDHDVGFDGINLETAGEITRNFHASLVSQMSKDKHDFNIQTECSATYTDLKHTTISTGLDVQTAGRDLVCTVRGDAQLRNLKHNKTGCGVSVTSAGNNYFIGTKIEDSILIGKRIELAINAGRMGGLGQVAYGGSFETTLRGRDYPVRNEKLSLAMTVLSLDKDMVFGSNINSDFRIARGTKMSVGANINSRNMGQICIKTSSSEHMQIGLIAFIPIIRALLRRKESEDSTI